MPCACCSCFNALVQAFEVFLGFFTQEMSNRAKWPQWHLLQQRSFANTPWIAIENNCYRPCIGRKRNRRGFWMQVLFCVLCNMEWLITHYHHRFLFSTDYSIHSCSLLNYFTPIFFSPHTQIYPTHLFCPCGWISINRTGWPRKWTLPTQEYLRFKIKTRVGLWN